MRRIKIQQIEYISGQTPAESVALFNEAMLRLAQHSPTFERSGTDFYIFYEIEKLEVEDEDCGSRKKACCNDCVFLSRDLTRFGEADKRKKWATCSYTGVRTNRESAACDIYYKKGRKENEE